MMNKGMRDKDMLDQKKSNFRLGKSSLMAQSIKKSSACFLGREDPLEEGMATHGQRSLEGYSPWGRKSQTRLSDLLPLGPAPSLPVSALGALAVRAWASSSLFFSFHI